MTHMDGKGMNILEENIKRLKELFPEIVTEGKVDFDMLRQVLGDYVEEEKEAYSFTWSGKGKALRHSQTPSTGTLRPAKKESKEWDTTKNLYIEGDNLEVLKLLQKSYFGRIRVIYIDPPYNTGKDFVYKDDYRDSIVNYKKITGQIDTEGQTTTTNPETSGRYHRDWLNMMYPRLRLARNLLSEDGVIFISIDDNEVVNLRKICDEVFGESNRITQFVWEKTAHFGRQKQNFYSNCEYVLAYSKDITGDNTLRSLLVERVLTELEDAPLYNASNPVNDLVFPAGSVKFNIPDGVYHVSTDEKFELLSPVTVSNGTNISIFTIRMRSRWSPNKVIEEHNQGCMYWVKTQNFSVRVIYSDDKESKSSPKQIIFTNTNNPLCTYDRFGIKVGTNDEGSSELQNLIDSAVFSYPKPVSLIRYLVSLMWKKQSNDFDREFIVLDFFSGSATAAQAVMDLNAADNGNRRYIMVQLPEPVVDIEVSGTKYQNICEVGKERIERAGDEVRKKAIDAWNTANMEQRQQMRNPDELDIGFKVFKLDSTNLIKWNPDRENLETSLLGYVDNLEPGRTEEDLLYEVMLKMGADLTWPIEAYKVGNQTIYSVGFGALMVCLSDRITTEVADTMVRLKEDLQPETWKVVFKDSGFADDMAKTNIRETLKCAGLPEDAFTTL